MSRGGLRTPPIITKRSAKIVNNSKSLTTLAKYPKKILLQADRFCIVYWDILLEPTFLFSL